MLEPNTKKVILADDNQTFLMYMGILLKRLGFTVLPAESGLEVLKILKFCEPDVVILDVRMGGMDGTAILRYIKEDRLTSNIPVIMVSSDSSNALVKKCKSLGCAAYLKKPVKIDELHNVMETCIFSRKRKKRKYIRVLVNKKVIVVYNGIQYRLYTENISEKGIYIRKKDPFPVGSPVEVLLHLDDRKSIRSKGIIVHTKKFLEGVFNIPPGMGIEFKNLSGSQSRMLKNYIKKLIGDDIIDGQEEKVIDIS